MRGSKILYENSIINLVEPANKTFSGGRNPDLIKKRNEALVYRYCFYYQQTGLRYELIIGELSGEFFLAKATIIKILTESCDFVLEVKKKKTPVAELKTNYPHFNWSLNSLNSLPVKSIKQSANGLSAAV